MKKILAYISSAVAVLLSASCTERADLFDAGGALSFEAQITDLETRADYVAGEDKYHENEINTMDWFFFSDEEGTDLLYHKTTTGENAKTLTVPEADVEANGLRGKSYLYAVANGPEGVASKRKLADILAMPVSTEFTKTEVDDEGSEALKLDVDNLKFIMDTYDSETKKYLKELSPKQVADGLSGSVQETIKVQLSRLAVKFSTKVKIAKSVTTTDTFGNTETWTPVLSQTDFDVYMMNALKAGTMSGEPIRRADEGVDQTNYFSYGRNLATVEELTAETDYYVWKTVDPFYTYPQKWNDTDNSEPYIKIIFPWMSDVKGSAEFHYKVVLPTPEDHVFSLDRNCWYQLTATIKILGGTENDYVLIDDVEVSVANWADPGWLSGAGLNSARFFNVPIQEFDVYSQTTFDIPVNTNGTAKVYIQKIEFKDYSGATTATVTKNINKPTGSNFTTTFTYASSNFATKYGEHDYKVTFDDTDKYNKKVVFEHSLADLYIVRDITIYIEKDDDPDRNAIVIIHHHPAIELKKQGAGDVFVNGRFARVVNAVDEDGNSLGTSWTSTDGKTFYHSPSGWASNTDYYGRVTTGRISSDQEGTNGYGTVFGAGNLSGSISTDFYTTDITVTAFSSTNNYYTVNGNKVYYKIGDPRVPASQHYNNWSLNQYLYDYSNYYGDRTRAWESASSILICSQETNDRSLISPRFLISSALNSMADPYITFENAVKRAATYQEAGYPAGRWRLPTEAEIAFIIARQADGSLPILYAQNSTYWAGSGRIVNTPPAGSTAISFSNASSGHTDSCRFVYDLWYWGDDTMSTNQYHPNQHEH